MTLLLTHLELSDLSCEDCRKWIIDPRTHEPAIRRATGKPQRRAPGQPTPCQSCPKGSPERAKALALSRRQWTTVHLYLRVRATYGACLNEAERADPLLLRNLALIDGVWRQHEGNQAAVDFAFQFSELFPKRKR